MEIALQWKEALASVSAALPDDSQMDRTRIPGAHSESHGLKQIYSHNPRKEILEEEFSQGCQVQPHQLRLRFELS